MASIAEGTVLITVVSDGVTKHYGSIQTSLVMLETKFFDLEGYTQGNLPYGAKPLGSFEKTLQGLLVELAGGNISSVSIYVGVKQRLKDDAIWYGPFSLEDGDDMIYTIGVEDARHFAFRLVDETPQSVWKSTALELYGTVGEGRR